jgi:hypothetical protein
MAFAIDFTPSKPAAIPNITIILSTNYNITTASPV